jgi:hypothetical protein
MFLSIIIENILDFLISEKIYDFVYKKDMFNSLALKGNLMHIS